MLLILVISSLWIADTCIDKVPIKVISCVRQATYYCYVYRGYTCYRLYTILKGKLKSFQHFLWMALTTCLISLMCAGWGKYPGVNTQMKWKWWKLGGWRIMLQTPLLSILFENTQITSIEEVIPIIFIKQILYCENCLLKDVAIRYWWQFLHTLLKTLSSETLASNKKSENLYEQKQSISSSMASVLVENFQQRLREHVLAQ